MAKIDESCINHNVDRLIKDVIQGFWDCLDSTDDQDHFRIALLGTIDGIRMMADAMKEVLKE